MALKLSRLWQPRNPAFWLLVVLNLLSVVISLIVRSRDLSPVIALVLGAFALGNALLGLAIAWRMMRGEPNK